MFEFGTPPVETHPASNACSNQKAPAFRALGTVPSFAACAAATIAWRNASSPEQRCSSICFARKPRNVSQTNDCACRVDAEWMPTPDGGTDSARILWPCVSNGDCSHNGVCDAASGKCTCDAAWSGHRCGTLQLEPVDPNALGYRPTSNVTGENVSSWGAPVHWDETTALWHGWASEMVAHCGINAWETNSQIVHIVSTSAFGPFARKEVIHPAFAHEPAVERGPHGEWVMAYSSFPLSATSVPTRKASQCLACANGTTPKQGTPGCPFQRGTPKSLGHTFKQMLGVSTGPAGPWRDLGEVKGLTQGWDWNTAMTIDDDPKSATPGAALAMIRGGMTWYASNYADNTTWRAIGAPEGAPEGPQFDFGCEDPYVWRDRRNASIYHAIVHAFTPFYGAHAWAYAPPGRNWSAHGAALEWRISGAAYGNEVTFTDGSSRTFVRRERPHLIWSKDGLVPIALTNGVQYEGHANIPDGDGTFTLIQPLRTKE